MAARRKNTGQGRSAARRRRSRTPAYEFHGSRKPRKTSASPARARARTRALWRKRLKVFRSRVAAAIAVGIVALALVGAGLVALLASTLPDTSALTAENRQPVITVLDRNGEKIGTRGLSLNEHVPLEDMPAHLPLAVLAVEDRRFYSHWGIDIAGLARAAWTNYQEGRIVQGGSTITQQLAKNVFLTSERTLKRKAQEALLAVWLEHKFSKNRILELYLNRVYLGAGTYGVEAAARRYFGKPARDLALNESALIAGLLKAPSKYAPTASLDRANERARLALNAMVEAGFITQEEMAAAYKEPAVLVHAARTKGSDYALDYIVELIPDFVGDLNDNVIVETTLDLRMQKHAEEALLGVLARSGKKAKAGEGALVALDVRGGILAMVGGRSYVDSAYNRAVTARRQPGSAFKPFVYATALESGWREWDVMEDEPVRYGKWAPTNYGDRYFGTVSLGSALARSINTVAIKLSDEVGRPNVIEMARRLGVRSPIENVLSLALGTQELGLLELTSAYAPFANGGDAAMPHAIKRIRTESGRTVYVRSGASGSRVLSNETVGAMNRMLSDVVIRGTGTGARMRDRPSAGKTGTTQDHRDAWFIGYTAQIVAGVWIGNDDFSPMNKVTGGTLPAEAWRTFMVNAHAGKPALPLPYTNEGLSDLMDHMTSGTVGAPTPVIIEPLGIPGAQVISPEDEERVEDIIAASEAIGEAIGGDTEEATRSFVGFIREIQRAIDDRSAPGPDDQ